MHPALSVLMAAERDQRVTNRAGIGASIDGLVIFQEEFFLQVRVVLFRRPSMSLQCGCRHFCPCFSFLRNSCLAVVIFVHAVLFFVILVVICGSLSGFWAENWWVVRDDSSRCLWFVGGIRELVALVVLAVIVVIVLPGVVGSWVFVAIRPAVACAVHFPLFAV